MAEIAVWVVGISTQILEDFATSVRHVEPRQTRAVQAISRREDAETEQVVPKGQNGLLGVDVPT